MPLHHLWCDKWTRDSIFYYIKHGIGQGNKQFWAVEETLLKHFILEGGSLRLSKFTSLTKFLKLTRTKGSFLPRNIETEKWEESPALAAYKPYKETKSSRFYESSAILGWSLNPAAFQSSSCSSKWSQLTHKLTSWTLVALFWPVPCSLL